jgi:hypothetical protein
VSPEPFFTDDDPDDGDADETDAGGAAVVDEATVEEGDVLPADLDPRQVAGPYEFPDNSRRRIPGLIYLVMAGICAILWLLADGDAPLVNDGVLWAAGVLALVGVYHLIAGWKLGVDEGDALVAATRRVGFPVGHASAQMGWRGYLSKPTWRILLYSADEPPSQRGLVLVDGQDGDIIDWIVEDNPEDWSEFVSSAD